MTPRRLDVDAVTAKLRLMRELLDDLEPLRDLTAEKLIGDRMTRHAVERILTQLVDLAVSVNGHISAALVGRAPEGYRDSFALAADAGAISDDLVVELAPSAGLRNVLIHKYATIDLEIVAGSVPRAVDGYRRYVAEVARFISAHS